MTERTITVASLFGNDKQLTRPEFIRTWTDYVAQLERLSQHQSDSKIIADFLAYTEDLAGRNFDDIYERQNR